MTNTAKKFSSSLIQNTAPPSTNLSFIHINEPRRPSEKRMTISTAAVLNVECTSGARVVYEESVAASAPKIIVLLVLV
jgi:hypothetical protein